MSEEKLVVVHAFGSQMEADLAKGALESGGIEAIVLADSAGGMRPHLAWASGGFKLLVREEDEPSALAALEPLQQEPAV